MSIGCGDEVPSLETTGFTSIMTEHNKLSAHARTCRSALKVYRQYKEAKNPKLFRERHLSEISRFEAFWQQLKRSGYKKIPSAKFMKEKGDRLSSALERCRVNYAHARTGVTRPKVSGILYQKSIIGHGNARVLIIV